MNILTKKGMTLFELLAVIVILGIVAAIAFPTVNTLINNTKKDAIAANATNFVQSAITNAKSDYTSNGYVEVQEYYVYVINDATTVDVEGVELIDLSTDFTKLDNANITITISESGNTVVISDFIYSEPPYSVDKPTFEADEETITRKDINEAQ